MAADKEGVAEKKENEWTLLLIFAVGFSALGCGIPVGYCIGVTNSLGVLIKNWSDKTFNDRYHWKLSEDTLDVVWASIVSVFLIGGCIGSLTGACIANRFGRRNSLVTILTLFMIAALCFISCRMVRLVELLFIGRIVAGLGAGLTTSCLPMYVTEIAPLNLRSALSIFFPVSMTAGVVIGQVFSLEIVFGRSDFWHFALSFHLVFVCICLLPICFYPESPKWLIVVKKDMLEGEYELKRLRGNTAKESFEKELRDMVTESQSENPSSSFKQVLTNRKLGLPLFLVVMYLAGQQLSGINAIFYYSISTFEKAGLSRSNAEWANLGAGFVNLTFAMLGSVLIAKFDRRPLMLFSLTGCAVSLLLLAISLFLSEKFSGFAYGCIAFILLYLVFFQSGFGQIPFFLGTELFEVEPRPVAMAFGSLATWSSNFFVGMTFPTLQKYLGAGVFLIFTIACILLFVLTIIYLPETKGKDQSEVAILVENGFKSKVYSKD